MFHSYYIKYKLCQEKNFIAGMHGKVGNYTEDSDLSLYGCSNIGISPRNS